MTFTEEQLETAHDKLKTFDIIHHGCPICGSVEWAYHQDVYQHTQFEAYVGGPESHTNIPALLVSCEQCGYIMTFQAEKLGVKLVAAWPLP